ncbi:tetratricopeptide repeat protein [Sphingorhabdus lutea]|nr:tetratricopeptide repeat protein [Sphingorhabdus lutea]
MAFSSISAANIAHANIVDKISPEAAKLADEAVGLYEAKQYSEATVKWLQSCDLGNGDACFWAAKTLELELSSSENMVIARGKYARGCSLGNANACNNLGVMMEFAKGGEKNIKGAKDIYDAACKANLAIACQNSAIIRRLNKSSSTLSIAEEEKIINQYSLAACDLDLADGCTDLGVAYYLGSGVARNMDNARLYSEKGCMNNSMKGCENLASMYREGRFGDIKPDNFINDVSIACSAGFYQSCDDLRALSLKETDILSVARAQASLYSGCSKNIYIACTVLGKIYHAGYQSRQDFKQARLFFTKACDNFDAVGCYGLASMEYHGEAGPKNIENWHKLLIKSCSDWNQACYDLGNAYAKGDKIVQNIDEARNIYSFSCNRNYAPSCKALNSLPFISSN